jgi:uncharacterized protein YchJ
MVGTTDRHVIRRYIEALAAPEMKRHWLCPCGSGRKIRQCHDPLFADLRKKIRPQDALRTLGLL